MKNVKDKVFRFTHELLAGDVRELCIRKWYYTGGTNEQYNNMFSMCGQVDEEDILAIAKDIKEHSTTDDTVADIIYELTQLVRIYPYFF